MPDGDEPIQRISGRPGGGAYPGGESDFLSALSRGVGTPRDEDKVVEEMRKNRSVNRRRTASANTYNGRSTSDITFATGRPADPMFYWKQNNLPYDITKQGELEKIREYCNTPEAPIWMGDYSFKPIGEVQVGDEVIGWTYTEGPSGEKRKKLTRSTVLAVNLRVAPEVVKVHLESGRTIRCTPDHRWANPHFSPGQSSGWQQPEYRSAQVGHKLMRVIDPTEPLTDEKQRVIAAWLGGIYDGEGSGDSIGQSRSYNPAVCERIKDSLDALGLPWTQDDRNIYIRQVGRRGSGFAQDLVNFLNWTQPTRRTTTAIDKRLLARPSGGTDRVVRIESEGPGEVVSMQTTTGNYVVWGFASKNCRLLYMTHPIIASAIDIFSKYPLTGMELTCKDKALTEFYTSLFFDQLGYEDFLIDVGREYWTVGEAWPLGSFNETLGVWEDDELINPDDVNVIRSPFLKEPRFEMRLPETLRKIIQERSPRWEFEALMRSYPELKNFMGDQARMPVSNILLKQLRFKGDTFHPRGIPILMRGFRAVYQEEMLNAAQDAIASRLYTPLILARLGASATDLGTNQPWIPTRDDLEDFEDSLDAALAADFRVLVHHFAVQMESVFGRENMPQMDSDFDRLTDRQLQVFGLSRTMLSGADAGETYAADALNRDLISQLLTTFQRMQKKFVRDRMLVVAEAQEHYDYEMRGGKRYPIMEEVLERDEETGEDRIVEQPKLLVPDLNLKAMNMKSESDLRQFLEALRAEGVPISMKTRLINVPVDLTEEIETTAQEQVDGAVKAQEVRKRTYLALKANRLPIPDDLKQDFEPKADDGTGAAGAQEQVIPTIGTIDPASTMGLAPTPADFAATPPQTGQPDPSAPAIQMLPRNQIMQPGRTRPPESDEQRAGMPTAAARAAMEEDGITEGPGHLLTGPRHIGMRRFARVDKDTPLEEAG